ncbi:hypothetical protein PAMP_008434 [Pampus punctatissimus]
MNSAFHSDKKILPAVYSMSISLCHSYYSEHRLPVMLSWLGRKKRIRIVHNIPSDGKLRVNFTGRYLSRSGLTAISIGMDPDSVLARLNPGSDSVRPVSPLPAAGKLPQSPSLKWRRCDYTRSFIHQPYHPIGRTTSECLRPPSFYLLFALSVKVTTPLRSDVSLTVFRANLFANCYCPSRKIRMTIGRAC